MKRILLALLLIVLVVAEVSAQRSGRSGRSSRVDRSTATTTVGAFYGSDYKVVVGGDYFANSTSYGTSGLFRTEYLYLFNQTKGFGVGGFGEVNGVGNTAFTNNSYSESGYKFLLGLKGRYQFEGSYFELYTGVGYGEYKGTLANGFEAKAESKIALVGLVYRNYLDRQYGAYNPNDRPFWFNDSRAFIEYTSPWPWADHVVGDHWGQAMHPALYLTTFKAGVEIDIIDVKIGNTFLLPIGVTGQFMQYTDINEDNGVLGKAGLVFRAFPKHLRLGSLYFSYQAGDLLSGSNLLLGVELDLDWFLKEPGSKGSTSPTTRRGRR